MCDDLAFRINIERLKISKQPNSIKAADQTVPGQCSVGDKFETVADRLRDLLSAKLAWKKEWAAGRTSQPETIRALEPSAALDRVKLRLHPRCKKSLCRSLLYRFRHWMTLTLNVGVELGVIEDAVVLQTGTVKILHSQSR